MAGARLPPAPARITAIYAGTCAAGCVHLPLSAWATDTKDTFSPKGRVKTPRTRKGSVEGLENNEISILPQTNEGTRPKSARTNDWTCTIHRTLKLLLHV